MKNSVTSKPSSETQPATDTQHSLSPKPATLLDIDPLTPSEIESLRQESKRDMELLRAVFSKKV